MDEIKPRHITFGGPFFDPEEVTERVRRAQIAILNPSASNPLDYLNVDTNALPDNERQFSLDYISLQISGPGLVDLSFIDLPGKDDLTSP